MNHTEEPWVKVANNNVFCESGNMIFGFERSDFNKAQNEINAKRIVACVNFCKGLSTENMENDTLESSLKNVLERTKEKGDFYKHKMDKYLDALREISELSYCYGVPITRIDKAVTIALKTINEETK